MPREELQFYKRKSGVPEGYIKVIEDMYDGCETIVRSAVGATEGFGGRSGTAPGICPEPIPVCSCYG